MKHMAQSIQSTSGKFRAEKFETSDFHFTVIAVRTEKKIGEIFATAQGFKFSPESTALSFFSYFAEDMFEIANLIMDVNKLS